MYNERGLSFLDRDWIAKKNRCSAPDSKWVRCGKRQSKGLLSSLLSEKFLHAEPPFFSIVGESKVSLLSILLLPNSKVFALYVTLPLLSPGGGRDEMKTGETKLRMCQDCEDGGRNGR